MSDFSVSEVSENIFPIEWNMTDELKVPFHGSKVFGTFVCGGGSTMGYKLAGYDHLGGVEFTPHYSRVYRANHAPKHFYEEDIRLFNQRDDLPKELFELDLLDGSPPCAAFSTSGARDRLWGKESEYEGIQQLKDDLVFVYCDTIEKLKPKTFLLENVSGLMKGNAKNYLKRVVARLSETYDVQVFLLYAASMGIPQIRNRVFVLGARKDLDLPKIKMEFRVSQVPFSVTKKYWQDGGESIEKYAIGAEWDSVVAGGNSEKYFNLYKPHPNKPCFTISAAAGAPSTASVCHPFQKRKLNVNEVRMLSTFPLDYDFLDVNPISIMGRSVLPVMMANISNQVYLQWLSKTPKTVGKQ